MAKMTQGTISVRRNYSALELQEGFLIRTGWGHLCDGRILYTRTMGPAGKYFILRRVRDMWEGKKPPTGIFSVVKNARRTTVRMSLFGSVAEMEGRHVWVKPIDADTIHVGVPEGIDTTTGALYGDESSMSKLRKAKSEPDPELAPVKVVVNLKHTEPADWLDKDIRVRSDGSVSSIRYTLKGGKTEVHNFRKD